tara:strand:- start:65 stop:385 length:321 start_codon:yes stop_codon:yes gene_type:complete
MNSTILQKRINSKKHYDKNKVDINDSRAERYHNEGGKERQQVYVSNNRDKTLQYQKDYYHKNKIVQPKPNSKETKRLYMLDYTCRNRQEINRKAREKYHLKKLINA